jgi:hypothetical protein
VGVVDSAPTVDHRAEDGRTEEEHVVAGRSMDRYGAERFEGKDDLQPSDAGERRQTVNQV